MFFGETEQVLPVVWNVLLMIEMPTTAVFIASSVYSSKEMDIYRHFSIK